MPIMAEDRIADRSRAIEAALLNIEKRFGKGSIMRLGEREVSDIPAISTTSLSLDAAIGVGGVPRGRIVEIYGPESSGKTTLALHIVAEAQKAGGVAAYIDAEHAMDADYSAKLGVNVDDMLISQPDSGEQALEIADQYEGRPLITTEAVLIEIGDALARGYKKEAVQVIENFLTSEDVEVVRLTPELFAKAFGLFTTHQDKQWGMTDCISFVVMREAGVDAALTFDRHFMQAGFRALLRQH